MPEASTESDDRPQPAERLGPAKTHAQPYDRERWMTAAWGSALTMVGARRGGFGGGLLATLGAVVAVRAAMGRHDFAMARHWVNRHAAQPRLARQGHRPRRVGRVVPGQRLAVVDADRRRTRSGRYGDRRQTMNMELTFPDDAREARRAVGSEPERDRAVGVDRRRRGADGLRAVAAEVATAGCYAGARRAAAAARRDARTATSTKRSASIRPADRATRARRCAARAASTSSRASRSTVRSRSCTASGAISRTCRSSCGTSSRSRSVTDTISHWRATGPAGTIVEWDAEIINESRRTR